MNRECKDISRHAGFQIPQMSGKTSLMLDLLTIGNLIISHAYVFVLFEQLSVWMHGRSVNRKVDRQITMALSKHSDK